MHRLDVSTSTRLNRSGNTHRLNGNSARFTTSRVATAVEANRCIAGIYPGTMNILGIGDNHDASAALVVDGVLVAASSQERFDREKGSAAFPWDAMADCLKQGELAPGDVHQIVFGNIFTPPFFVRRVPGVRLEHGVGRGQFTPLLNAYIVYQVAVRRAGLMGVEAVANRRLLTSRLAARGYVAPVRLVDHHVAHAHSAWRTQPEPRCLVFTCDAMGDGVTAAVWLGGPAGLRRLAEQSGMTAINTFYSRITEYLGFTPLRHEGKITGLAAFVSPPDALLAHCRRFLSCAEGRLNRQNYLIPNSADDPFHRGLQPYSREQIAAAAQRTLEEVVVAWVRHWVKMSGVTTVALAGGLFGNVKLNQRVCEMPEVRSVWVYPNMGDGGLAVGAALLAANAQPTALSTTCLGAAPTDAEMRAALVGRTYRRLDDPAIEVATLLAAGKVVARCVGRMEFGPRALGNRSILARADDPAINGWLNERLRRTEFMPFAPMVLSEHADALFVGLSKADARFMTVCFETTAEMRRIGAAAVHVDGTARPQLIEDGAMADILRAYAALTGSSVLINTSFNLHEEPIVNTAADAVRAWEQGRLDALLLGPYLVTG